MSLPATVVLAAQAGSPLTFRNPKDSSSDQEEQLAVKVEEISDDDESADATLTVQVTSSFRGVGA